MQLRVTRRNDSKKRRTDDKDLCFPYRGSTTKKWLAGNVDCVTTVLKHRERKEERKKVRRKERRKEGKKKE